MHQNSDRWRNISEATITQVSEKFCGPVIAKFLMNITLSQLSGDEMAQLGFHAVSIESISLRDHLKRIEPIAFGKLMDGHISRGN